MKLERRLFIGGVEYPIIKSDATLQLSSIGRAVFIVRSKQKPTGIVSFQAGYTTGTWFHYFLGIIKNAERRDKGSWIVDCKELSEALLLPCTISLRDCSVVDVAADMQRKIGISFDLPSADYTRNRIPRFANTTDALSAIQNIGRAFNIQQFIWQLMPDGQVWLGDHSDSKHAKQGSINIPENLFTKQKSSGLATLPALPALRAGMIVNNKTLDRVRLIEMETHIQWSS